VGKGLSPETGPRSQISSLQNCEKWAFIV
jgi:hypothetical protein